MKKSLIIILFSITALVGKVYAQSPTLDEKIDWLNGQVPANIKSKNLFFINRINFHNPIMIAPRNSHSNSCQDEITFIDFKEVKGIELKVNPNPDYISINFSGNFTKKKYDKDICDASSALNSTGDARSTVQLYELVLVYAGKEKANQILKAFLHLAKLQGAKLLSDDLFKN